MDVGCSNGKVMVAWTELVAMCQYMSKECQKSVERVSMHSRSATT